MTRILKTTALALLLAMPSLSQALERTALVPPDAQSYVRISNAADFLAKLKVSAAGKLWADRQFQDFLGNPDADTWEELMFDGDKSAEDQMYLEQLKMLKGEVIVAFDPDHAEPAIIAAMGREDYLRSLVLDEKLATSGKDPFKIVKDAFQGVDVIEHINAPGTPDEKISWQAHLGHTLVMGHNREWVEQSIIQLKKEAATEPDGNPVLNLNLPLAQLIRSKYSGEQDPAEAPATPDPNVLLESLGLLGIERFTTRIELKDTEMVADSTLQATSLDKGIFTILDLHPSELPSANFIPENIALMEVGRFNLLRFWQEIPTVLTVAMPTAKPQFDMMLSMVRQQTGIDIEQDLLVHLGTRYISFSTVEGDHLLSVMAIDLKDSQAFKHGLETAMASPALQPQVNMMLDTIDFLGHTLYVSKNIEPSEAISFAVMGNYLLYGHPDGLRQVIRTETSGTATGPAFEGSELIKGMQQIVPKSAFGYSAVDWKKCALAIVRELTKPDRVLLLQKKWALKGGPIPPPDFNKLPPADHIASFFNVSYQYIEKTDTGLHQRIILKY